MTRAIFIFFLLLHGNVLSIAQNKLYDVNSLRDTLTATEIDEINEAAKNTTFGYLHMADSCSGKNDSVHASLFLAKISPYHFLFLRQSPLSIDTFLTSHFKIKRLAKEQYIAMFTTVYNNPVSVAYNVFKSMAEEDQNLRHEREKCADSKCYYSIQKQMEFTDNQHFDYLHQYIAKNGWPSLADGSLYASVLATHDQQHYPEYIPLLRTAIIEGKAELNTLKSIIYWNACSSALDDFQKHIAYSIDHGEIVPMKFKRFNIDDVLDNNTPANMGEIREAVKNHCPVYVMVVCECHSITKFNELMAGEFAIKREANALGLINQNIAKYDCNLPEDRLRPMNMGLWSVYWKPSDHEEIKMILYLKYGRDDTGFEAISNLITDKKFTTHAVNFDVNRSTIKPESACFIRQLAAFLKSNPEMKLEIDGHTDSDGDAASNMILSKARADEIKKQLVANGLDSKRLVTKGFGASRPLRLNTTSESKAINRRVEFIKL